MAHFTRTRAAGLWSIGPVLLSSELDSLDAKTFAAINGDAGGVWIPSAVIEIGGAGVKITGDFFAADGAFSNNVTVGGTLGVDGDAIVAQDLQVSGTTLLIGNCTINGGLTCAGLQVIGGITLTGDIDGDGAGNFASVTAASCQFGTCSFYDVDCENNLIVSGTTTLNGALQVNSATVLNGIASLKGTVTLEKPVICTMQGRIRGRILYLTTNANVTVSVDTTSTVVVPLGLWSAGRVITVDSVGAAENDILTVINNDSTYTASISGLTSLAPSRWVELVFRSGAWTILRVGG